MLVDITVEEILCTYKPTVTNSHRSFEEWTLKNIRINMHICTYSHLPLPCIEMRIVYKMFLKRVPYCTQTGVDVDGHGLMTQRNYWNAMDKM